MRINLAEILIWGGGGGGEQKLGHILNLLKNHWQTRLNGLYLFSLGPNRQPYYIQPKVN